MAGETYSFGPGPMAIWILKLHSDGMIDWQKTYGGEGYDRFYLIQQTVDQESNPDGYILAGSTDSFSQGDGDAWILKLNSDGSIDWQKTYGGSEHDRLRSIQQTFNHQGIPDGYIIAGELGVNDSLWAARLNLDGSIAWQKNYGARSKIHGIGQTFKRSTMAILWRVLQSHLVRATATSSF